MGNKPDEPKKPDCQNLTDKKPEGQNGMKPEGQNLTGKKPDNQNLTGMKPEGQNGMKPEGQNLTSKKPEDQNGMKLEGTETKKSTKFRLDSASVSKIRQMLHDLPSSRPYLFRIIEYTIFTLGVTSYFQGHHDKVKQEQDEKTHAVLVTKLDGIKADVSGMPSKIDGIKNDVIGLDAKVGGIKTDVIGLDAKVGGLDAKVGGIKTDVIGLGAKVDGIKNDVDDIKVRMKMEGVRGTLYSRAPAFMDRFTGRKK